MIDINTEARKSHVERLVRYVDSCSGQMYSEHKFNELQSYRYSFLKLCLQSTAVLFVPLLILSPLLLPFNEPKEGLMHNWTFILSYFIIGSFSASATLAVRLKSMILDSACQGKEIGLAAMSFAITTVTTAFLMEHFIGFPVPFTTVCVACPGMSMFLFVWFVLEKPPNRQKMLMPVYTLLCSFFTMVLHEIIGVLYTSQRGTPIAQSAIAMLLPVAKFVLRKIQMGLLKDYTEGLALATYIFEIKFFNTLYTSVFLQKTESTLTMCTLMSVDILENGYFLYSLNKRANALKDSVQSKSKKVLEILLRTEMVVLLELIEVITPILYGLWLKGLRNSENRQFYKGFRDLSDEEFTSSIWNIVILIMVELFSMGLLILVLKKKHRLPILPQLSFSIERYHLAIFATMTVWSLIALTGPLDHVGNDYTFQFDWLEQGGKR